LIKPIFSKKRNILVIGDIILDRYISGRVDRMSAEAPVPVLVKKTTKENLGGAANVAANVLGLGSNVLLFGFIGKDEAGSHILDLMSKSKMKSNFVLSLDERKTTIKTRFHKAHNHLFRMDEIDEKPLLNESKEKLTHLFQKCLSEHEVDGIILEDYNLGVLFKSLIESVLNQAKLKNIPVFVDPKIDNFELYKNIKLFKPNKYEFEHACKWHKIDPNLAFKTKALELYKLVKAEILVLTDGKKGMVYIQDDEVVSIPTIPLEIGDVCGAGDAVISVLTLSILDNYDIETACKLSNLAAGVVCQNFGVFSLKIDDLIKD